MATKERWKKASIIIDRERGYLVFERLLAVHRERKYPFSYALGALPWKRENLPSQITWHSKNHAMFLFILCLWMRGGIASDVAAVKLAEVFRLDRRWFDPYWARNQTPEALLAILAEAGLAGLAKTNARYWIENCKRLCAQYQGNPLNILKGVSDYDEACARIKNSKRKGVQHGFMGFQEKMVSMIIYFIVDARFPGLEQFLFPIPVDIHVMRILLSNEVLRITGMPRRTNFYIEPVLARIREYFMEYCTLRYLNASTLSDILWLWSRELCTLQPGNTLRHVGGKNRKSRFATIPVNWNDPNTVRNHRKSCGSCPCNDTCSWSIPSAVYYRRGEIFLYAKRERPPEGSASAASLFDMSFGDTAHIPVKRPPSPKREQPLLPSVIQGILYAETD